MGSIRSRQFCALVCLLLACRLSYCASAQTVTIPSPSMGKRYKATVILPESYKNSARRYSVIYFLHGYSQDYSVWPKVAPLEDYADKYETILVCPDGNRNSWYLDSPVNPEWKFETYVAMEVPVYIDSVFRTNASFRGRALTGSSMGGHGALAILLKHPDRFAAASSISGILDLGAFRGRWDMERVLGPHEKNVTQWRRHSVIGMLDSLSSKDRGIFIDCGLSDPALPANRRVHDRLIAAGVAHHYREAPGGHTPSYVRDAVEFHILYLTRILQRPAK